jgi:SPP1 family predicted phage head-tail adaptor
MATRFPSSAGELNQRVQLQRRSDGQDGAGQPVETWPVLATVFARVTNLSGVQLIKAGADTSVVSTSIVIRYRADVDPAMRVVYRGNVYQITAVIPDEGLRQYIELLVEMIK